MLKEMKSFAIVLVCYKRLSGIKLLLDSLERADYAGRKDITLIFSIDNSGDQTVENFAKEYCWTNGNKIVRTFQSRQGLKKHILQCGDYTEQYDIVTVLEDDIVVSDSFYQYAYQAAEYYWDDDNIAGISLYNFQKNWLRWVLRFEPMKSSYDTYFIKVAQSWGQVWTKNKWIPFKKWLDENSVFEKSDELPTYLNNWPETSWLKFHDKYCIECNKYFVYPYYSLSSNTSEAGEHANISSCDYQTELQFQKSNFVFQDFSDESIRYDEYFEREGLGKYLGLSDKDVFVDLYGTRRIDVSREYVLSTNKLKNVDVVKSFRLFLRPIETSIMYGISGDGIYLYRSSDYIKNVKGVIPYELMKYEMRTMDWRQLFAFSVKLFWDDIKSRLLKIRKK